MPRMMGKKSAGQQSLFILVAGVCLLVHFVLMPIASSTVFATSSPRVQTREASVVAMHATGSPPSEKPAEPKEPEEEEEEEEDETSYGMLSEEQKAAVEAIITASRKAANITDVLREELALKTLTEVKVEKLEASLAETNTLSAKRLTELKEVAKDLGVGGLLGVMMNFMSTDDIAKEAKQKIVELKKR
mmetsp:Transcript_53830/g.125839  ORF Transcript_53830/g.125839 Transcript_53830/m.125839 type:complete len:189 (-) Transcript_53830:104-670(-)